MRLQGAAFRWGVAPIPVGPAGSGTLQGTVKHVRSFGPIQRADIALAAQYGDTLVEIDAPRDNPLSPGDLVGLKPRRFRIFAAEV